ESTPPGKPDEIQGQPTDRGAESPPVQETLDYTPMLGDLAGLPRSAAEAPSPPPQMPASFGRYVVRGLLGRGGFGMVYLGHDTQLDRPVAIKLLRSGRNVTADDTERFLQEARRVARLRHPGIATVHD